MRGQRKTRRPPVLVPERWEFARASVEPNCPATLSAHFLQRHDRDRLLYASLQASAALALKFGATRCGEATSWVLKWGAFGSHRGHFFFAPRMLSTRFG